MFYTGDFLIGKENNAYNYTNNTALMIVSSAPPITERISVVIVAGYNTSVLGRTYPFLLRHILSSMQMHIK